MHDAHMDGWETLRESWDAFCSVEFILKVVAKNHLNQDSREQDQGVLRPRHWGVESEAKPRPEQSNIVTFQVDPKDPRLQ